MHDVMEDLRGRAHAHDDAGLAAFVRNRYFYGKLLDVYHLELEQRYLNEKRWLMNRLGLGTGVLCGLELESSDGKVVLHPGVAIDSRGREIVVTDAYVLEDPLALTDTNGRPTGDRAAGTATICLAFHECDIEPAPVLVSDCDVREECRPGAVRERFRVLVREGRHRIVGDVDCAKLSGEGGTPYDRPPGGIRPIGERPPVTPPIERAAERLEESFGRNASLTRAYAALCDAIDHSCAPPDDDCVPIGVVKSTGDDGVYAEHCGFRVPIYSNVVLLDLIVCVARSLGRRQRTLRYEEGDVQMAPPGSESTVAATLLGEDGDPLADAPVSFRIRAGEGTVGGDVSYDATSAADGRVEAQWRLGEKPGLNTLEAEEPRGARIVFQALAQKGR
jgi:hypothetical protein